VGYQARAGEQPVKRAVADDDSGVPASQSQVTASRRPPIVPEDVDTVVEDDSSGLAGGASGGTGGGSSTPGHPDAEQTRARRQPPS
jgi:hypothetical protein